MALLYRAAGTKKWIANGVPQDIAFRRRGWMDTTAKWCPFCRQEVIERVDEHGLSVATSPEAATAGFDAKGMIEIDTDKFPPEYSIILDPDDANHQLIRGLPFDLRQDNNDEQESEVVKHANALRACARVVPLPGLKP